MAHQLPPHSFPKQSLKSSRSHSPTLPRSRSVQFLETDTGMKTDTTFQPEPQMADSSADEITPIVSHERGVRGKERDYNTTNPNPNPNIDADSETVEDRESLNRAVAQVSEERGTSVASSGRRRRSGGVKKGAAGSLSSTSGGRGHEDEHVESEGKTGIGWLKKTLEKYGSVELDNKGSVARDHLALERTFLAWLRTSLAFASIGIAITQLFRLNTTISEREGLTPNNPANTYHLKQVGKPLGATFLGIAILVLFVGGRRYFESQYWIIRGKFPASRGSIFLITFVAVALIVTSLIVVCVVDPSVFEKK